jgi:hypothetical protein
MPLDNATYKETTLTPHYREVAILDKMADLLDTPDHWCKDTLRDGDSLCLLGALNVADHGDHQHLLTLDGRGLAFEQAVALNVLGRMNSTLDNRNPRHYWLEVANFNNAHTTTHADVVDLIARTLASFTDPNS